MSLFLGASACLFTFFGVMAGDKRDRGWFTLAIVSAVLFLAIY